MRNVRRAPVPFDSGVSSENILPGNVAAAGVTVTESETLAVGVVAAVGVTVTEQETLAAGQVAATGVTVGEQESLSPGSSGVGGVAPGEAETLAAGSAACSGATPGEQELLGTGTIAAGGVPPSDGSATSENVLPGDVAVSGVTVTESTAPLAVEPPAPGGGGVDYGDESSIYPERYATRERVLPGTVRVDGVDVSERTVRLADPEPNRFALRRTQERVPCADIAVGGVSVTSRERLVPGWVLCAGITIAGQRTQHDDAKIEGMERELARLRANEEKRGRRRRALAKDDDDAIAALSGV